MKLNKGVMMEVYEGRQRCNDGGVMMEVYEGKQRCKDGGV